MTELLGREATYLIWDDLSYQNQAGDKELMRKLIEWYASEFLTQIKEETGNKNVISGMSRLSDFGGDGG